MDIAKAVENMYTVARAVSKAGDGALAHDIMVVADRLNKMSGPLFTEDDMDEIRRSV